MRFQEVIAKAIRRSGRHGSVAGSVNAVVSANVGEPGRTRTTVSSRQRVVQRNGRTVVTSEERYGANQGGKS
jgi:hypothetical protein